MNNFPYSKTNKRYHTLDYFYKQKFGCKVFKVSLNAGFTCPNIDGTKGFGGCIYCSKTGSGEYGGNPKDDLIKQFNEIKETMHKKWPKAKYIGYFQARSNTYAPVSVLKEKYEKILKEKNVIGLSIATRCDCITDECLKYLSQLNKKNIFDNMVKKLKKENIFVVAHIINGLPYEAEKMMIDTVKHLNDIGVDGIKIHMLSITKDTPLEKIYKEKPFPLLTKDEYVNIVVKQLEHLNEKIVIQRLTGDPKKEDLIKPKWLIKKVSVLNDIDKLMAQKNSYQGKSLK